MSDAPYPENRAEEWAAVLTGKPLTNEELLELDQRLYGVSFCDSTGKRIDPHTVRGWGP